MSEIEQPIYLGHVAVQPAGQFGFADPGGSHCGVECQLGFRQCRQCGEWPLGASAGHWDLATIRHIADENRFNGIRCAEECFFSILAEGDGPWDVGDLDQNRIVGVLGKLDAITEHVGDPFFLL